MNRIQNRREGGISDVYDVHEYADENKQIVESVAAHILALAEGRKPARARAQPRAIIVEHFLSKPWNALPFYTSGRTTTRIISTRNTPLWPRV
jgi:hypothetical protein